MLLKSTIVQIVETQRINLFQKDSGLKREALELIPDLSSHALIVSGVRRCGKSTLLFQLLNAKYKDAIYLNFEDPRLYEFEGNDFTRLDEIISESNSRVLFFDEIQIINEWERYIRQKLDEGFRIVVTGSNASLLSKELGTKLTGRHITKELFPFSYNEFCLYSKISPSEEMLVKYLKVGGFPEYVKRGEGDILGYLLDDILVRDIAVRYGVRDIKTLQRLTLYLISNVGNLVTGNKLKTLFGVGATSTIMEYLSHLEYSYLIHLVPKFSYSLRKQIANPRKVYAIDTGMVNVNSASFTDDNGRKFENLIFLHLRRKYKEIYYFSEKGECDFIVYEKETIREVIQVCFSLNQDNLDRELNGLLEALEFFNLPSGTIVTLNQNDRFERNGKIANIVTGSDYLQAP
ncbi:MAG: ATP-binding protein [Cyclobacteriaceae bacterium]